MGGSCEGSWCIVINWFHSFTDSNWVTASTILIAVFTVVLTSISFWQGRISARAIKLAREEFNATHRPYVKVRFTQGPFINEEGFQQAWVTVVNVGETPAWIVAFGADLPRRNKNNDWEIPGISASAIPIVEIQLVSGQRHFFTVTCKSQHSAFDETFGEYKLYLVGEIRYRDSNGVIRETGFFRVYDESLREFTPSKTDEGEYQD